MKGIILFTLMLIGLIGHSQQYNWSYGLGGVNSEFLNAIDTDNSGDVYSTGSFQDNMDFDFTNGIFNINTQGPQDIFIQKTSSNGGFEWAKSIGSSGYDSGEDIVVDADGNIITVGYFQNAADFDPGVGSFNMSPIGTGYNGFIIKLNPNGDLIWAKQIGYNGNSYLHSIDSDGSGNLIIGGSFQNETDLDPGTGNDLHTSTVDQDGFILKLDLNGNFIWSHILEADSTFNLKAVRVDNNGDIGVVGHFEKNLNLDPGASNTSYFFNGLEDIFIMKLSSSGNYLWSEHFGSTGADYGNDLAFDSNNNLLITGGFGGAIDFDPSAGNFTVNPAGLRDIFTLKMDANGNFIWIKQAGSSSHSQGEAIVLDPLDNIYTSGYFKFNVDFDPGPSQVILDPTLKDVFVQKLDKNGVFRWARQIGGDSDESAFDLALSPNNDLLIGGYFEDSADFDFGPGTIYHFSPGGSASLFLTQWGNCDSAVTSYSYTACQEYQSPSGLYTYTSSGVYYDTLSSYFGCDSVLEINLTIQNINTSIAIVGSVFTSNQAGAVYQWLNCDAGGTAVSGATQQSFTPAVGVNYAAVVTFNGCTDTTSCINLSDASMSETTLNQIEIYPNPGRDQLFIKGDLNDISNVLIYDLDGKIVSQPSFNISTGQLTQQSNLTPGIYFVELIGVDSRIVLKWCKL